MVGLGAGATVAVATRVATRVGGGAESWVGSDVGSGLGSDVGILVASGGTDGAAHATASHITGTSGAKSRIPTGSR
jgi:hypothetical protein